jgi:hypothetical protein
VNPDRPRRIAWAAGLAAFVGICRHTVDFVSLPAPDSENPIAHFRSFLTLGIALPVLASFITLVGLLLGVLVALVRQRWRQAWASVLALLAFFLIIVAQERLPFCDPYYWYVRLNAAQLEAEARARSTPGEPVFALLEGRDASTGMVGSGNDFMALVYDETDAIGQDAPARVAHWPRDEANLLRFGGLSMAQRATHLSGHFFLLDVSM